MRTTDTAILYVSELGLGGEGPTGKPHGFETAPLQPHLYLLSFCPTARRLRLKIYLPQAPAAVIQVGVRSRSICSCIRNSSLNLSRIPQLPRAYHKLLSVASQSLYQPTTMAASNMNNLTTLIKRFVV